MQSAQVKYLELLRLCTVYQLIIIGKLSQKGQLINLIGNWVCCTNINIIKIVREVHLTTSLR